MFCGLFRNNTEKIAVIFGEKNQFCIVYFNLNKMWIFLKKKKKCACLVFFSDSMHIISTNSQYNLKYNHLQL
jgi:hypothetical protein